MTVLVVNGTNTVVVTDNNNNSVKSFYTRNKQPGHSRLSVCGTPFGITKLKDNQVAVTVPGSRQILSVQVNPDLVLLSTIKTSKRYWGITSVTPSTLAASSAFPLCVDILDMTGHVLSGSKCVMCLAPEGDVVFTYSTTGNTSLKYPRGITTTSTGDILVTDNHLHRVLHLTESGQFVRNMLTSQDGVQYPCGVCYGGRGRMYVCMSDEVKLQRRYSDDTDADGSSTVLPRVLQRNQAQEGQVRVR
ncbi:uncharacterized protein LOC125381624 [Haliotis rufescens]|uniref:uncharacterized protein LOC125381624 n=1 Tax=Haliotis rufescens TaxID=6454 RepID=UPI00201E8DE6|nr:uncharacterized protein LOC125381624 [Haliotis rufescens]